MKLTNKIIGAFALSAIMLAACGKKEEPPPPAPAPVASAPAAAPAPPPEPAEEKVLNIYNWPDYIPEGMVAAFEKESGIKVNYDTFETNEALHAKLVAGNSGYDIVVPGTVFAKPQIEGGLLQPLDKIPNLANLDPAIMKTLTKADPDNKYLVPWGWGFTTVGINKTKVEKALGKMPMPENAWDLVFDPKYTSKLKSCGIASSILRPRSSRWRCTTSERMRIRTTRPTTSWPPRCWPRCARTCDCSAPR